MESNSTASHPAPDTVQVLDAIAALWAKAKPTMVGRVGVIESATLSLMERTLDDETRRVAEREAHKLAGTVGTFGFATASRLAREIELLLGGPAVLTMEDAIRLADLVVALEREIDGEPSTRDQALDPVQGAQELADPCLLLVSAEADLSTSLQAEAAAHSLNIRVVANASELLSYDHARPEAVVIDLSGIDDLSAISQVRDQMPGVPILVLSDRASFADRLKIARLGTRTFLSRPCTPREILDACVQALLIGNVSQSRVLALDDDPAFLEVLDAILAPTGIRLISADTAERFWAVLEESRPDLVLLDLDMPGIHGLDLCRMLRADPRLTNLPVLFLSGEQDPVVTQQIFAAGADDYVAKPLVGSEILTRITNRLERVRLRSAAAESDPLTGLATWHRAELAYEQFLRLAARQSVPVALAAIRVDDFEQLSGRHGQAIADQVLRHVAYVMQQRFRNHDVATRVDGGQFLVGMYGASREIAVLRLNQILQTFRDDVFIDRNGASFGATFSAGVAEFPDDGQTLQDLYRSSNDLLRDAMAEGPATISSSGKTSAERLVNRTVDVVIVEDDDVLATLLLHALSTRGYESEWYRDGETAARALAGPAERVRAQVVLLDVGLPGLDGFDVLRRLVDHDVTKQTRVIMLTAHAAENEVLEALKLGAFDHVAKPFSTPVLLQRIRRATRH